MNMLSSLKALLFSSTAARVPAEGAGVASGSLPARVDFARFLSGSITDAGQEPPVLEQGGALPALPDASPIDIVLPADGMTDAAFVPVSKGEPGARAVWRSGEAPLPPGLALGLVKHAAAMEASASNGRPGAVEADPPAQTEAFDTIGDKAVPDDAAAPESPATAPAPGAKRGHALPKEFGIAQKAQAVAKAAQTEPPDATEEPASADEDDGKDGDEQIVATAPTLNLAMPVVMPVTEPAAVAPSGDGKAPKEKAKAPVAIAPSTGAGDLSAVETPPAATAPQAPDPGPRTIRPSEPMSKEPARASLVSNDAPAASNEIPPETEPLPVANGAAAAPVLNGKPKAEAIALLQLVHEQVAARQSGATVHVGEQVSAAAKARHEQSAPAAGIPAAPQDAALPPAAAAPLVAQAAVPATPGIDLTASLGAQVVDLGVSGQWIDGLARDIAGLSANGAQGRFQINADQLGPVQVEIRQGSDGAAVHLTVASEAAEQALRRDGDRLKLDAGLAAVRIAEVKIERAPVAEAGRTDSGGQQSSQQQSQHSSSQGQAAWANSQDMSQPQGQQGRWQGRQNNGFDAKSSGDPAVLNHEQARKDGSETARARYA